MTQQQQPKIGNWGRWGPEDERGALNLLTPQVVLGALQIPKKGKVYSLSLPIQSSGVPAPPVSLRPPPIHLMAVDGGDWAAGARGRMGDVRVSDDFLMLNLQGGTSIDGLAHVWLGAEMYNGFPGNLVRSSGAHRLGIENAEWIIARGVLVDIPAYKGVPYFKEQYLITRADVEGCARAQGVELRAGDALLVRTGYMALWDGKSDHPGGPVSGIGIEVARFVAEKDIAVVGADQVSVETNLASDRARGVHIPVHVELIRNHGVHLLEMLYLEELARDRVYEFLFVVAPLKIRGASGSPINPVAVV